MKKLKWYHLILLLLSFSVSGQIIGDKKLMFSYDAAGNRIYRNYCEGGCRVESRSKSLEDSELETSIAETIDNSLVMFPNPTSNRLNLSWVTP